MSQPKRGTILIAALTSAAIIVVSGVAVWRHLGGSGGDTPAQRSAIIAPISAALAAAGAHSISCATDLAALPAGNGAPDDTLHRLERCGEAARVLAEKGYATLDNGPHDTASPRRAAFLDAAGSLFSVYELQGDDFDVIYDMVHRARSTGTSFAALATDISYILSSGAPDVEAARQEAARAEAAYRKGG